jgi:hypothetical protein
MKLGDGEISEYREVGVTAPALVAMKFGPDVSENPVQGGPCGLE